MKKLSAVTVVALAVILAAAEPVPDPKMAAMQVWVGCILDAGRRLDDGKTDMFNLTADVILACREEFELRNDAFTAGGPALAKLMFIQNAWTEAPEFVRMLLIRDRQKQKATEPRE